MNYNDDVPHSVLKNNDSNENVCDNRFQLRNNCIMYHSTYIVRNLQIQNSPKCM